MRKLLMAGATALALAAGTVVLAPSAQAATGLKVSGRTIVEANGSAFLMRGVNHPYAWYRDKSTALADIKRLGANTVRMVLTSATTTSEVSTAISLCRTNRLICVLENHDTTGYGERGGAITLDQAVNHWVRWKNALRGTESHVVINIGNEPFGNTNASAWTSATTGAVRKLRSNGFEHLVMVDAPNWGQDWQGVMRANAASVLAADPKRNTVFSVHMYGVYGTAAAVRSYLGAFQNAGLPLVIGEFGANHSDGNVDENAIMAETRSRGVGYLGWSWSGNSGGVEYLDMATGFDPNRLTSWGRRIFTGADGIKTTAREATTYRNTAPTNPPASTCTTGYQVVKTWTGGYEASVTVRNPGTSTINNWTVGWSFTSGQTVTQAWDTTLTTTGSTHTARPASHNKAITAGAHTTFGFTANGSPGTTPRFTCTAG